jgi:predicted DsbA family dithiol-disulfide isomerase
MRCFVVFLGVFFSVAFSCRAIGQNSSNIQSHADLILAEVGGTKVTLADFERKRPDGLFHAYNVFYQAERKAVEEFIDDYMLEAQAKKEGITVAQLVDRHVNNAIAKDPSEEVLRVLYETIASPEPYEKVRPQILKAIRDRRLERAKHAYIETLRADLNVKILLAPPRAEVETAEAPMRGPANAPVKIVEYGDFECPYCQKAQSALDKVTAEYKDKVALVYKDWPLENHANAEKAAEAAHCAGAQGKYWQYHDLLYSTKQVTLPELKQHAVALGLDAAAFNKCLDSGEKAGLVKAQLAEGQGLKLEGTPSFFINGRFFVGVFTEENLRKIIEEELRIGSKPASAANNSSN